LAAGRGGYDSAKTSTSQPARALLATAQPLVASHVLRSFLAAYLVVASALERIPKADTEASFDEAAFLKGCLAHGRQFLLQKRILSLEAVSHMYFQTALRLTRRR